MVSAVIRRAISVARDVASSIGQLFVGVLQSEFCDTLHDAIASQACGDTTRGEGLTEVDPYRRSPRAGRHAKNTP